jgi:plastocyanin
MKVRKLLVLVISIGVLALMPLTANGSAVKHVRVGDDLRFHPKKLKVHKGTKVLWKWDGMLLHNVTVTKGPVKFHSKTMTSGTYSHTFKKKGTYTLVCTVHGFKMTVKVR